MRIHETDRRATFWYVIGIAIYSAVTRADSFIEFGGTDYSDFGLT